MFHFALGALVEFALSRCRVFSAVWIRKQAEVTMKLSILSVVSRYGGISVGGQLPILDLQPKDIQDSAAQLGQMLNITGVTS